MFSFEYEKRFKTQTHLNQLVNMFEVLFNRKLGLVEINLFRTLFNNQQNITLL